MAIGRVPGQTGIQPSIVTAKGDLIVATASGSVTNQAVGSNNQVLTADSAQADGVKWANGSAATLTTTGDIIYASAANTPARLGIGSTGQVLKVSGGLPAWGADLSGGMTLLATTTFNNTVSTYTFSSLGSYKHLLFLGTDMQHNSSAANSRINMRFNSDSGSNYGYSLMQMNGTTYSGTAGANQEAQLIISVPAGSVVGAQGNATAKLRGGELSLFIPNYGSSNQVKAAYWQGGSCQDGTRCQTQGVGRWYNTSAITSVTINFDNAAVNFHTGTLLLYGVD